MTIPGHLVAVARARIAAEFVRGRTRLAGELEGIQNRMSAHGLSNSGVRSYHLADAFQREMQARATFAWATWSALLSARRLLRIRLAATLKEQLRQHLTVDSSDLATTWHQRHRGPIETLESMRSSVLDWAEAEIDYAIDSFDWSRQRELRVQVASALLAAAIGAMIGGCFVLWAGPAAAVATPGSSALLAEERTWSSTLP